MKKHIPNTLSLIRLCLAVAVLILAFFEDAAGLGPWLFVIAVVSDKLDGSLARLWNVESELGKKLESTIDPILASAGVLYLVVHTDFPLWFIGVSGALLLIATAGRLWIKMKTGTIFYEKSQLTRYGVGLLYLIILFYLFTWPGRQWLLSFGMVVGVTGFLNYCRMMFVSARRSNNPSA
jgi:phosphatidylglycerophosphate synthase